MFPNQLTKSINTYTDRKEYGLQDFPKTVMNEMNKNQEISKISTPFFVLGLCIIGVFTNNHPALFIADYYILLLVFLACVTIIIIKRGMVIYKNRMLSMAVIMVITLCIGSIFHVNELDFGTLFSYIIWFLVIIYGSQLKFSWKTIKFLMYSFFSASLIIVFMIIAFKRQYVYQGSGRSTIQFGSNVQIDPNYLANYMFVGLSFGLFLLYTAQRKVIKKVCVLGIIVILWGIVLTGSRAGLLCSIISILGFALQHMKDASNAKKVIILFLVPVLLILAYYLIIMYLPDEMLSRFAISSLRDSSNARRLDHWYKAIIAATKNPVGYGSMHTMQILEKYTGSIADAHNTFLTIQLQFGIVGLISFVVFLFKTFKMLFVNLNTFWLGFVFAFILNNFIIANHLGISFWVVIMMFYYISELYRQEAMTC